MFRLCTRVARPALQLARARAHPATVWGELTSARFSGRAVCAAHPVPLRSNRLYSSATGEGASSSASSSSSESDAEDEFEDIDLSDLDNVTGSDEAGSPDAHSPLTNESVGSEAFAQAAAAAAAGAAGGAGAAAGAAGGPAINLSEAVKYNETVVGDAKKHEFQAETRKLLDIVARSLYTDKEIFVRELVSNASDALEKFRHKQATGGDVADPEVPPEVQIYTDSEKNVLVIQDSGIGMSEEELVQNLGTIAHSGTQKFMEALEAAKGDAANVIGQFGVGFYSTFMVSKNVEVYTRSAEPGSKGLCWTSDGTGSYTIAEADGVSRGTKIVIHLNDDDKEFADPKGIENIIKKHSNFIQFDIKLNGDKVNKIQPLWTKSPSDVTAEEHKQFYQFIANAYDDPLFTSQFAFDTPLNVKALLYVPGAHSEKYGMGRMDPGVSLFCRKVLIQGKMKGLLPDWLRFVKGVVDCEDIPLNLSREHLQDSALVRRLGNIITRRILKFLAQRAEAEPEKFEKFFNEFGGFLKEGLVTDFQYREDLGKLLRMESSHTNGTETTTLDAYLERAPQEQEFIYYLVVPRRDFAEQSPYYEGFKKRGYEVLFLYSSLDDFVMNNLSTYKGKKLVSIESAELPGEKPEQKEEASPPEQVEGLKKWLHQILEDKVTTVKESSRLVDSPAIVVDHESASFRRMMRFVDPAHAPELPKQQLEINPDHPIMRRLQVTRSSNPELAKLVANQVFDNALVAAGLVEDPRSMLPRLNELMEKALSGSLESVPEAEQVD